MGETTGKEEKETIKEEYRKAIYRMVNRVLSIEGIKNPNKCDFNIDSIDNINVRTRKKKVVDECVGVCIAIENNDIYKAREWARKILKRYEKEFAKT